MFESNLPVDKVSYAYNVLYKAFKRVSQGYSPAERAALFHDTAARPVSIDSPSDPTSHGLDHTSASGCIRSAGERAPTWP